jgi:hypothetical protein
MFSLVLSFRKERTEEGNDTQQYLPFVNQSSPPPQDGARWEWVEEKLYFYCTIIFQTAFPPQNQGIAHFHSTILAQF